MALTKEKLSTIGVDLGGTEIKIGLVDEDGAVLFINRYPTDSYKGPEEIINGIVENVRALQNEGRRAQALGIGVAGQVDPSGIVIEAPNLPLTNEPLKSKLERHIDLPVMVTNDVRAATFGEWLYGAGKNAKELVVIFVGTGIGGGVVSGGELLKGCTNSFGELGHLTLVAKGRKCRCPNWGCLEAYAGGWAIAKRAQEIVSANPSEGKTLKSLAVGLENITAKTVSQAYHLGDPLARKLVERTGHYLGAGIVGIVNAFNPCLLVLGGGVIEGLPPLVQIVEDLLRKQALKSNAKNLKIARASLQAKAGVIGAAALARNKITGR